MELEKSDGNSDVNPSPTSFASWFDYLSLEDFLGSGSFGFVFKAISGPETLSAVKVIFLDASGKSPQELEDERDRIFREYKLMQGKHHTNVCKILKSTSTPFTLEDFETMKNLNCLAQNGDAADFIDYQCIRVSKRGPIPTFCIQMELCGKTLRQWLNAQSVDNPELLPIQRKIIVGLAKGLKYLHDNNIMHRDFRPENIMFSHSLNAEEYALPIKIGDFGLCRRVHSEQTRTRTLTPGVGQDSYRAPETTGSDYGFQADLFSLGLVIWEVIQLIKHKDTRTMFHKLVHESKTNLVKQHTQWLPNMREIIISLTKRRVQDRARDIPKSLVKGFTTVETGDQLRSALEHCRPGDTIEICAGNYSGNFILSTNNITITGKGSSPYLTLSATSLHVKANHCIIKDLPWHGLEIMGNDNRVTNVRCQKLELRGDNNKMSSCVFIYFYSAGLIISGLNNRVHSCILKPEEVVDLPKSYWEDLDEKLNEIGIHDLHKNMGQLGLILTPDSYACIITDGSFVNAIVCGSEHKLTNITLQNTLVLRGNSHVIKNCKGLKLQDESQDSVIMENEFVEFA